MVYDTSKLLIPERPRCSLFPYDFVMLLLLPGMFLTPIFPRLTPTMDSICTSLHPGSHPCSSLLRHSSLLFLGYLVKFSITVGNTELNCELLQDTDCISLTAVFPVPSITSGTATCSPKLFVKSTNL